MYRIGHLNKTCILKNVRNILLTKNIYIIMKIAIIRIKLPVKNKKAYIVLNIGKNAFLS